MAMMPEIRRAFAGKTVLLTGHTGFKGGWLSLWLEHLGARVHGLALKPDTAPSFFDTCRVADCVDHALGDIRDLTTVRERVAAVSPDFVFHLAAQPLVRRSYDDPLETMATNVMGTAHVLEAIRRQGKPCSVVVVSSDKCYENRGWIWGYRESDPLGGHDPYSASKAATELIAGTWRDSFFAVEGSVRLATARAGNVIGGGDWSSDRIVPDCIQAFIANRPVELRNPIATRPWQHVLEPLGGYLLLAARLAGDEGQGYAQGWNFGPAARDVRPVEHLVNLFARSWPDGGSGWRMAPGQHPAEARALALNCDKAAARLGWYPTWSLETAAANTARWYQAWHECSGDLRELSRGQIAAFEADSESA